MSLPPKPDASEEVLTRPSIKLGRDIPYGEGLFHFGELRLPEGAGPHPVVIAFHGGFWRAKYDLRHLGHLCAALTSAGLATWSVEYRRVGHLGGGFPGTLEDAAKGAAHLFRLAQSEPLDLKRVILMGHSAGGHLALWAAKEALPFPLRGVLSLAGLADLMRASSLRLGDGIVDTFVGGDPCTQPSRFAVASPAARLPLGVPQVLIHGEEDNVVPLSISQEYFMRARAAGDEVSLERLPGCGHFALIDPEASPFATTLGAIRRLLK